MAIERTLSIIKPDAVEKKLIGQIFNRFGMSGMRIIAARFTKLSKAEAEGFYAEHKERPFFNDLVKFMTSGPVMISVLEGEGAVMRHRDLMGATDPAEAKAGTLRADYADSIEENAVHGSDSLDSAGREIAYFFDDEALHSGGREA